MQGKFREWKGMNLKRWGIYNTLSVDITTVLSLHNKLDGFIEIQVGEVKDLLVREERSNASFYSE